MIAAALIAWAVVLMLAESWAPARPREIPRLRRWRTNAALWAIGAALAAVLAFLAAPAAAIWAEQQGWGLLRLVGWPIWLEAAIAFAALDLALYLQHRALHAPGLWRLHAAHHADPELDVSTGVRFHPFERIASMAWKSAVVVALGAPVWVALAFEAALTAASLFTHANITFPAPLERALRTVVITPMLHRLHHDRALDRDAPNFGTLLNVWDRLFGTWKAGGEPERLGLDGFADRGAEIGPTLVAPFRLNASASSERRKRTKAAAPPA